MDYDADRQYPRGARASPTMPLLLVFLVILGLCVITVWIESNYGILEGIFRIVSTDDERSSVEERLQKYSGSSQKVKKSKRKRKSKKRKSKRMSSSDEDSAEDSDDDDSDRESNSKRKKRRRRKFQKKQMDIISDSS